MNNIKLAEGAKGWFEIISAYQVFQKGGDAPVWEYILLSDGNAVEFENIINESDDNDQVLFDYVQEGFLIQNIKISEKSFEVIIIVSKAKDDGRCIISGNEKYLSELMNNREFNWIKSGENLGDYVEGSIDKPDLNELKNYILNV